MKLHPAASLSLSGSSGLSLTPAPLHNAVHLCSGHRPLDRASAAAEARANSAALCWREGFTECLPVGEVPELFVEIQIPNYTIPNYTIPSYPLLSKLGEGAMADVWLAEHQINKHKAAIKILKPKVVSDEQLFVREGQVLVSFDHPNIVRIHDRGRVGKLCYLVMECLQGGTLEKRMDPNSPNAAWSACDSQFGALLCVLEFLST